MEWLKFNPEKIYKLLEMFYRHGALDKVLPVAAEAITRLEDEKAISLARILNGMNEVGPATIGKMERYLARFGFLLNFLAFDIVAAVFSRLLDVALVRRMTGSGIYWFLGRVLEQEEAAAPAPGGRSLP
ncbi:MAG: hypothetical protein KKB90_13505 [Actinobacteria bacterium]|nr:hypothetical protein [Actinomycetota bacterium]MCG2818418.1 hypothetical protein [Actinomycetes bacterium]MBU4179472.1 hypothetical protein [Actinomycetota bacterium]MBU4219956.1 hypothetical protein [Actinomycetota bacterium]MBU4358302.1 hypothetical protein [Actinomycetota bacterium]